MLLYPGTNEQIAVKLLKNDQSGDVLQQLLLTYTIPLPIVLFNMLTNGLLILITIRSKKLRSTVNILIAFDAVCQLMSSYPMFVAPIILLTSEKTLALGPCFMLLLVPIFASHITSLMPLAIGIDRFACLFFRPNWTLAGKKLSVLIVSLQVLYALIDICLKLWEIYSNVENEYTPVICNMDLASTVGILYDIFLLGNIVSPLIYLVIWVKIKLEVSSSMQRSDGAFLDTRKLFKSLCLIVLVNMVSWLCIPLTSFAILPLSNLPPLGELTLSTIILSFANQLGFSLMPIVLFFFCTEYTKALQKLCKDVCSLLKHRHSVVITIHPVSS